MTIKCLREDSDLILENMLMALATDLLIYWNSIGMHIALG